MFTAKDVQTLRQRTGAGMMECKKALTETNGEIGKAEELLRVKGIAKAETRSGKQTSEGAITSYIHPPGKIGVMAAGRTAGGVLLVIYHTRASCESDRERK